MSGSSSMPLPALGALAVATALLLGVAAAHAESADDRRLHQLAGQSQTYTDEVRALLAKGADPNVPDAGDRGRTALHAAARIGAAATLRALLEAGGNPNRRDGDGNTPLHLAAGTDLSTLMVVDSIASIRVLLRGGADAGTANARGRTPLHLAAARHDRAGGVAALLGAGADPNRKDRDGATPLHAAVGPNLGQPGVVRTLLNGGGDASARNGDGLTVLQLFVRGAPDDGDTAAMLIDAGADPDRKYADGDAPLHVAIRSGGSKGKVEVAEALLAGGADPCIRDAKGYTPYQIAREGGAIHRMLDRAGGYDLACDRRSGPQVAEVDRVMRAAKRSNVRSGPGTEHDKVGLLEIGDEVRVTGQVGDWLRIETPGGEAFVYASLLEEAGAQAALEPEGPNWSVTENQPCQVWNYGNRKPEPFTWSGACVGGKASGQGTLTARGGDVVYEGSMQAGKPHGHGSLRYPGGDVQEGPYEDGKRHGRWVTRFAGGGRLEYEWRDGSKEGQPGVYVASDGERYPGRWSDGCFLDDDGHPLAWDGDKSREDCRSQ